MTPSKRIFIAITKKMTTIIQTLAWEKAAITKLKLSSLKRVNKVNPIATRKMINKLILYFFEAFDWGSFISNAGDSFVCIIISLTDLVYYSIGIKR
jgi:hypothetical protein